MISSEEIKDGRPPLPPLPPLSVARSCGSPPAPKIGPPGSTPRIGRSAKMYLSGTVKDAARVCKQAGRSKALSNDQGVNELLHLRHHYRHLNEPPDVMKTRGFRPKYPGKGASHLEDYITESSSLEVLKSAEILHGNPNVYRESLAQQLNTAQHLESHHRRIKQASTTVKCWHSEPWYSYNKRLDELRKTGSQEVSPTPAGQESQLPAPSQAKLQGRKSPRIASPSTSRTKSCRTMSPTGPTSTLPAEPRHVQSGPSQGILEGPRSPLPPGHPRVTFPVDPKPMFSEGLLRASAWEHGHRTVSPRTSPPTRPHWWGPSDTANGQKEESGDTAKEDDPQQDSTVKIDVQ